MTTSTIRRPLTALSVSLLLVLVCSNVHARRPVFNSEIIIPYQNEHVHGSTIEELPNGDLLAAWFQGSGERWADDVKIFGARKKYGGNEWSEPFVLADVGRLSRYQSGSFCGW